MDRATRDPVFHISEFQGADRFRFKRNARRAAAINRVLGVFLPGAFAGIGNMENTGVDIENAGQHFCKVEGVSRRRPFIANRFDFFFLTRTFDHRIDKTWPIRAEHPRNTNDEMSIAGLKHELFARPL